MMNDDGGLDLSWLAKYERRLVWGFPLVGSGTGWLVWDKHPDGLDNLIGSPVEMASSTLWSGFRMVRLLWGGYYKAAGEEARGEHPTQKPLGVLTPYIEKYTKQGETVLDFFGGSGSTLIACERLGRRCSAIELDPAYCDVIVARWEKLTGKKATRE